MVNYCSASMHLKGYRLDETKKCLLSALTFVAYFEMSSLCTVSQKMLQEYVLHRSVMGTSVYICDSSFLSAETIAVFIFCYVKDDSVIQHYL